MEVKAVQNLFVVAKKRLTTGVLNSLKSSKMKPQPSVDIVEIGSGKFTLLEKQLMDEVREFGIKNKLENLETARIIDKKGDHADLLPIELPGLCGVIGKKGLKFFGQDLGVFGKSIEASMKIFNGVYVHNHNYEIPLSLPDIVNGFIKQHAKKIIATTPSGGFSYMSRSVKLKNRKKIFDAAKEIGDAQIIKLKQLDMLGFNEQGFSEVNMQKFADVENIKAYNEVAVKSLQDFADKFGFEFKYQLNP